MIIGILIAVLFVTMAVLWGSGHRIAAIIVCAMLYGLMKMLA